MLLLCECAAFSQNVECTASVLNRTVRVQSDGTWLLPNVPALFGPTRARITCVDENGVTTTSTRAVNVGANESINFRGTDIVPSPPIPSSISVTAISSSLTSMSPSVQLSVSAKFANGDLSDVTNAVLYSSSNNSIVTVSATGFVVGVNSGSAIISAQLEGHSAFLLISVFLAGDRDADGLPDDYELSNGLNPNDPSDAKADLDRDGLSNIDEFRQGTDLRNPDTDGDGLKDGEEVARGTNPLLADTDGDLVPDGLEVSLGTNPLDRNSGSLSQALDRLEVSPPVASLVVNNLSPEASVQLRVSGVLKDGSRIDLNSTARGTRYSSSNLTICNFGARDGEVFAGNSGSCVVTVTNSGFSSPVSIRVENFTPTVRSALALPGAVALDVSGEYAFVVGANTFRTVSIGNRAAPIVTGSVVSTSADMQDVRVLGNLAYVASGAMGLQVFDVSNRTAPTLLRTVDTPGSATDLSIGSNQRLYVADGSNGLLIFDLSTPTNPVLLSTTNLNANAIGVDVNSTNNLVAVALGTSGLRIVDVSNSSSPQLRGLLAGGNVNDVLIRNNVALLADLSRSFTSVDISNPNTPTLGTSLPAQFGGFLYDIGIAGDFAFGADIFFVNDTPVIDISAPLNPVARFLFRFPGDATGSGVKADNSFVYLLADGVLNIGQYRALTDNNGIPPTVSISAPSSNTSLIARSSTAFTVNATDDVAVATVQLLYNGQVVGSSTASPAVIPFNIPKGLTQITLSARAIDIGGNIGNSAEVTYPVIVGPLTTVSGTGADRQGVPIAGARVNVINEFYGQSVAGGAFSIAGVPAALLNVRAYGEVAINGIVFRGRSAFAATVPNGLTNVGPMVYFPDADWDGLPDDYEAANSCLAANSADDEADADFDSLSNFREYQLGTNPCLANLAPGQSETVTFAYSLRNGTSPDPQLLPTGLNQVFSNLYSLRRDALGESLPAGQNEAITVTYAVSNRPQDFSFPPVTETLSTIYSLRNGIDPATVTSLPAGFNESTSMQYSGRNGAAMTVLAPGQNETASPVYAVSNQMSAVLTSLSAQVPSRNTLDAVSSKIRILDNRKSDSSIVLTGQTLVLKAEASIDAVSVEYLIDGARLSIGPAGQAQQLLVPMMKGEFQVRALARGADGAVLGIADRTYYIFDSPDLAVDLEGTDEVLVEVHGLLAEFFESEVPLHEMPDFARLKPTGRRVVSSVSLANPEGIFGKDPLGTGNYPDLAMKLTGRLQIEIPGTYRFRLVAGDGAELFVNGSRMLRSDAEGEIELGAGLASMEIRYFSGDGVPRLTLEMAAGREPFRPIAAERWTTVLKAMPAGPQGNQKLKDIPVWAEPARIVKDERK
jgi:hypothetical protein